MTSPRLPVACALACLLLAGPAASQQAGAPAPKVLIAAAVTKEISEQLSFIGRGEAIDKIDLLARVVGFLREVPVQNGATVQAGEVLFRIQPEQYQANLASSMAALARAEANLSLANVELDRRRQLVARQSVAQSELDIAVANAAVAGAEVKSAEATIKLAELELSYTEVQAPFPGRIGRVERSVGDLVGPTSGALATLVRESPIFVSFSLDERQLAEVLQQAVDQGLSPNASAQGMSVHVVLPNGVTLPEVGHVAFASNQIDPRTGTLAIRAEFANETRQIIDGAFLTVRLESEEPVARLLIPQAAVQRDQRGAFVLVVTDQQMVEQRYITTGINSGTQVIVTDGLREGEAVIVEGLQRVRPGTPVQAVLAGTGE